MKKIIFQLLVLLVLFFGLWTGLSRIDFSGRMRIEEFTREQEARLGTMIWDLISRNDPVLESDSLELIIEKLKERICLSNDIDPGSIRISIIGKEEVNAFALPDRRVAIYSGLVGFCNTPGELAGVIAHEIAHIEKGHIMRKLRKEVGLAVLAGMVGGTVSTDIMKETLKVLSSTAYDRSMEREADMLAVSYLSNAEIDPVHLANFLFRISREGARLPREFYWISTHPEASERAGEILGIISGHEVAEEALLDDEEWESFKSATTAFPGS